MFKLILNFNFKFLGCDFYEIYLLYSIITEFHQYCCNEIKFTIFEFEIEINFINI